MKPGRPAPSQHTLQKTLEREQARRQWEKMRVPYVVVWVNILLFMGMTFPLVMQPLVFNLSSKHLETGKVVRLEKLAKQDSDFAPILHLRGKEVLVHSTLPPKDLTLGKTLTAVCTPGLLCRLNGFWPMDVVCGLGIAYLLLYVLLLRPLLRVRLKALAKP